MDNNSADVINWFSLPWDTFVSWFEWHDDFQNRRIYFTFMPPANVPFATYSYKGQIYYDYKLKVQKGYVGKDLEVVGFVRQCELGCFMGREYPEKLIAPKNGIFINLVDMERFKFSPHKAHIKPGESLFYIDYTFPNQHVVLNAGALDKLRELKQTKELGKNADETLKYLLGKYGISENDL